MMDIAIIGAGTAGLSAAIYGSRAGKSVVVLENGLHGGQIINATDVVNYPGIKNIPGYELAEILLAQAHSFGAEMRESDVTGLDISGNGFVVKTAEDDIPCRSVIIATGAVNRPIGLENEQRLIGSGISYCATCDGAFFRDMDVAIVGGGNTAVEDALFLSQYCRKVSLIHRRLTFRAETGLVSQLAGKPNIEFLLEKTITKLNGDKKLDSITVTNVKDGNTAILPVAALFVAIGQDPQNKAFAYLVDLDENGYIKAGEDCKTKIPGVFVAGDCRTKKVRQLITAASDGAVAALAAVEYLA